MYPFYLGIDLHLKKTYAVLMNDKGQILNEREIPNDEVGEYLTKMVPKETYAVLEATRNWPFMYDLLSAHVARVELAHPKELKMISTAAVKTDRIDARVLAQLARLNYLPTAYAAPAETRDLRLRMRHREMLIRQRTQCKNRIHAILAQYNLVSPKADLFGLEGREWLAEMLEAVRPMAKEAITDNLMLIDQITERADALEKGIKLNDEQRKAFNLLLGIPGIGKITATIIIAEIGDIRRFHSPKSLCNWVGLTPKVRSSAGIVRRGRISKQGSPFLRSAMTQAAVGAIRKSKRWRAVYDRLVKRNGKKAAKVAVARRLLTITYHMLTRDEPYQEHYGQAQHADLQEA